MRTSDNRVVLDGEDHGAIGVRLPSLAGPARRVTLYDPSSELGAVTSAHAGVGGVDFDPVPGSAAARREAWIRAHPRRHTFRRGGGAALGLIGPLVLVWLWRRLGLSLPDWSLPLPRIPWPDVPWPDLPDIPWPNWSLPDLPDLPGVPPWGGEAARYLGPVLIAVGVATGENRRRRTQDEAKRRRAIAADPLPAEPVTDDPVPSAPVPSAPVPDSPVAADPVPFAPVAADPREAPDDPGEAPKS